MFASGIQGSARCCYALAGRASGTPIACVRLAFGVDMATISLRRSPDDPLCAEVRVFMFVVALRSAIRAFAKTKNNKHPPVHNEAKSTT